MEELLNVRRGITLLETILVLSLLAILVAMAIPGFARLLDGIRVHGAASEVYSLFSAARHLAIARAAQVTVELDTSARRIIVRAGADTLRVRELGVVHDVTLSANRASTVYAANGIGYGASNLTLVISRGVVADTLTVSRLGRVKR